MRKSSVFLLCVGFACATLALTGCSSNSNGSAINRQGGGDPACSGEAGSTARFVDCGNGTVTDTTTGVIWLKNAGCLASQDWETATASAAGLESGGCGLTDNSSPGSWRLPTKGEWEAILSVGCLSAGGGPTIPDDTGTGCYATGTQWASGVQLLSYWSSTDYTDDPNRAWSVDLSHGDSSAGAKSVSLLVWPVR
jgi:hypothetical protein